MSDLMLLSDAQMRRIEPFFPLSHGVPRVDDRLVLSGIIFVLRNGLRWRDVPREYGRPLEFALEKLLRYFHCLPIVTVERLDAVFGVEVVQYVAHRLHLKRRWNTLVNVRVKDGFEWGKYVSVEPVQSIVRGNDYPITEFSDRTQVLIVPLK